MSMLPVVNAIIAQELRRAELDFYISRISSIAKQEGNPHGVEMPRFGSATAFYVQTMPWAVFNTVKGMEKEDFVCLADLTRFYRDRNRAFSLDVDPAAAEADTFRQLEANQLIQQGFHSMLYGEPRPKPARLPPGVTIEEVTTEERFLDFARVHCVGSGMSAVHSHHFANTNRGLLNRPGWKLFLASRDGAPAAVAMMHTSSGTASMTLAATDPEHRNRGLQTALVQWRMHEAFLAGCRLVTGQAAYGSTSQHNMERSGMHIAWTRAVYAPRPEQ